MSNKLIIKNNDENILIEEGFVLVIGGKIRYKIIGKNKNGTPILIVHGGPGVSYDYLEPLANLADERPVIFYNQLGCGDSERPDDLTLWTIERYVDELHTLIETFKLEKVHILGQSWGAALVTDYYLTKHPNNFLSIIYSAPLLSTSRWLEDQQKYIAELPANVRDTIQRCERIGKFDSQDYQDAIMMFYNKHVCRMEKWPDCLNRTIEKMNISIYNYMWGPSEFTVTGILMNYERTDRLKEINIPVLFTCGQYDEASPSSVKYFQQQIINSEIKIFEEASHEHHLEKTDEYLYTVRNFLYFQEKVK